LSQCCQPDGHPRRAWETVSVPADLDPGAAQEFRLPVAMGYFSNPPGKFSLRIEGKPVLDFDVVLHDQTWQSPDGKVRLTYTVMEDNAEDSNGILVIRAAAALLQPGKSAAFEVVGSAAN